MVPPEVHVVGALACGPKTVKVIAPPAPLVAPVRTALRAPLPIAVLVASVAGAPAVIDVLAFATTVEVMPDPHVLADDVLLPSPL